MRLNADSGGQTTMSSEIAKLSVLLEVSEAQRFDAYCKEKGFKKSSLTARLIRDHLDREKFQFHRGPPEYLTNNTKHVTR